jgi:hypothetical protein
MLHDQAPPFRGTSDQQKTNTFLFIFLDKAKTGEYSDTIAVHAEQSPRAPRFATRSVLFLGSPVPT